MLALVARGLWLARWPDPRSLALAVLLIGLVLVLGAPLLLVVPLMAPSLYFSLTF